MNPIQKLFSGFSERSRAERRELFYRAFEIGPNTTILDVGSEDGSNIARLLANTPVQPENVYIADIDRRSVESGAQNHGFKPVLLNEGCPLPFEDGFFDIVYCSSTLEHATVPKDEIWSLRSGRVFRQRSLQTQTQLANEISRVGKQFFVQTPSRTFPIESHSWLPFVGMLPREFEVPLFRLTNKFWVKGTIPDFYLLSMAEMKVLFPDGEISAERKFGFAKSWIAIRTKRENR